MSLFHLYYQPTTEFDRLFEDVFAASSLPRGCASSTEARHTAPRHPLHRPRLDLCESKDTDTVTATFELPGLAPEGVTIDLHQNRLTVSGESTSSDGQEEKNYILRERRSGKFSRTLQLPLGTKPEDLTAKMEKGVLTITFPKTGPEQQAKRIAIQ